MTWLLLIASAAFASELTIDAMVPTQVFLDGQLVGELAVPATVTLQADPGKHEISVWVSGSRHDTVVEVPAEGGALVVVGRTGVTTGQVLIAEVEEGEEPVTAGQVEFRATGHVDMIVVIGKSRHKLSPGDTETIELPLGRHKMSLRSADGTVVWATGTLDVDGAAFVVQVAEGRMPEVAGAGGAYVPDGY